MGSNTQFSLRTVFATLTACGVGFAILASFGVGAVVILLGGIAIHVVAVVLIDVLDRGTNLMPRTAIHGRDDTLITHAINGEDRPPAVECVVATDNQLDAPGRFVRFLSLPVNDDDLEALAGLTHLKWLVLDNTSVTASGLTFLHGLTELRRLYLRGSQVTPHGVQRLKLSMPNVDIRY